MIEERRGPKFEAVWTSREAAGKDVAMDVEGVQVIESLMRKFDFSSM